MRPNRLFALLLVLAPVSAAGDGARWRHEWGLAHEESREACRPLLIELGAPWCDACRRMEATVLARDGFLKIAGKMVLLRADADSEEGRGLQKRYLAPFMPTYLFLRPDGKELGRMVGQQNEGYFDARLRSWIRKSQEISCKPSSSKT